MWPNPREFADLVTFTKEILNGNLLFWCSGVRYIFTSLFCNSEREHWWIKIKSKATTGGVLWEKVFWRISQNSQENSCALYKIFLISLRKLLLFFKQSDFNFSDIYMSWRHQMPEHETWIWFYWITWKVNTVW